MLKDGEFSALVQCDEWIHLAGAPRGKIARKQCYCQEHKRRSGEAGRIACTNAVEELRQSAPKQNREQQPDSDSADDEHHSLTKNQTQYACLTSAQRQTNTNLAPTLIHGVGHNSIEADRGKSERQESEHAEEPYPHFSAPKRLLDHVGSSSNVVDRQGG